MKKIYLKIICLTLSALSVFSLACTPDKQNTPHEHSYSAEWKTDENSHYKECSCGSKSQSAEHDDTDADDKCDVCGYDLPHGHVYSVEWQIDQESHYKICVCGEKSEKGNHADDDNNGNCDKCGYEMESYDPGPLPTTDPSNVIAQENLTVTMEKVVDIPARYTQSNVYCYVLQGGGTDGKYYYGALIQSKKTAEDVTIICKYDIETGELVAQYEDIMTEHSNDLAYNPVTKEIIISHASPNGKYVSIFNAKDFTFKKRVEISVSTGAIAYDQFENCYIAATLAYVGETRYATFVKYDNDFNEIGRTQTNIGLITQDVTQNIDVDSKYIYYCQYKKNAIVVYDKVTGEHVKDIILPKQTAEAENVFHIGETLYVAYYNQPGGTLYKLNISSKDDLT